MIVRRLSVCYTSGMSRSYGANPPPGREWVLGKTPEEMKDEVNKYEAYAIRKKTETGWVVDGIVRGPDVRDRVHLHLERLRNENPGVEFEAVAYEGSHRHPFEE